MKSFFAFILLFLSCILLAHINHKKESETQDIHYPLDHTQDASHYVSQASHSSECCHHQDHIDAQFHSHSKEKASHLHQLNEEDHENTSHRHLESSENIEVHHRPVHPSTCQTEKHTHTSQDEHIHTHDFTSQGEHVTTSIQSVDVPLHIQTVLGIKTQRSERKKLEATLPLHGRFELDPDAQSMIVAPISGRLKFFKRTFEMIHENEILFTLTSPELITRWHEIERLKARLQTYQKANLTNVELETQLQLKQCEWEALVGQTEVVDGVLTVRSNINGQIEERLIADGSWCELGEEVLRLCNPSALRFKAVLPANDTQELVDGMMVKYGNYFGHLTLGTIAENGLRPLYVSFQEHKPDRVPGAYAVMECTTTKQTDAILVVPKVALLRIGLQPIVFIRDPHNAERFIAQHVTPGLTKGPWIEVKGLPMETVEVVVSGQYELKLALPSKKEQAVGHFHADGTFHTGEH